MTLLILGLILFIGVHSTRIVADGWRRGMVARWGEGGWKVAYALLSLAGLILIVFGYAQARTLGIDLWSPPRWTRHVAALLTLIAFVLLVAAYVPGTRIKAAVGHPMVLGVKVWALAHLISNGRLADIVLFGAFLVWSVASFTAARRRDRAEAKSYPAGPLTRDAIAVALGLIAWYVFAMYLHVRWIGVSPFG